MAQAWWKGKRALVNKQHGGNDMPPNLDEIFSKLLKQLKNKKKNNSPNQKDPISSPLSGAVLIAILMGLWIVSGLFIVAPAERAVVLRFGSYSQTMGPGIHWVPSIIQTRHVVNVQRIENFTYGAEMLTKDENIVDVMVSVQYRVADAKAFLYNVVSPINSLEQGTASSLRQVVGNTKLDDILTTGRALARDQIEEQLKKILTLYQTGIEITDVNLQPAKPPEQVTAAFDDAIKAREDEQRYINKAKAYVERVIPISEGQATRLIRQAEANKQNYVLQADADIAPFNALLPEYQRHPEETKQRLYLSTLEQMMSKNKKIFMDSKSNNSMFYIPLDQMFKGRTAKALDLNVDGHMSAQDSPRSVNRSSRSLRESMAVRKGYSSNQYSGRS
jgi:modulator of FtsH protease HflK